MKPTMEPNELDELKNLWRQAERRLEGMEPALRLNQHLAKADRLDRMRSKMRFAHLVLWYELASGVLVALLVGSYLVDHFGEMRFAVPAAALHLGAILTIGFAAWQLVALGQIDYGGPVLEIQRRLAALAVVRARASRWLLLSPRCSGPVGRHTLTSLGRQVRGATISP